MRIVEAVTTEAGVLVRYRTNEGVRVRLLLDDEKIAGDSRLTSGVGRVTWELAGTPPASGVTLVAVDRSGNRTEPLPVSIATP